MEPVSISEKLLYTTVRIQHEDSCGTGFFFNFKTDKEEEMIPVLITNKHVLKNKKQGVVTFTVHIKNEAGEELNHTFNYDTGWIHHPIHDLCCCIVAPIHNFLIDKKINLFNVAFQEDNIWTKEKLQELSAIEDVVMIGYPNGLFDSHNNLPIIRKGITASHPVIDFKNKDAKMNLPGIGVIDMACFPGSSGSPICILNEGIYSMKSGGAYAGSRVIFIGVLFSGPLMNVEGKIVVKNIPTRAVPISQTSVMMNLGYYIKAEAILDFKQLLSATLK